MGLMQLKCQNCGGELEFDEANVKVVGSMVIWRSHNTLTCKKCGTQFARNSDLSEDKGSLGGVIISGDGNTVISTGGGAFIGGGLNLSGSSVFVGGDVCGGDKVTIITGNGNKVIRR